MIYQDHLILQWEDIILLDIVLRDLVRMNFCKSLLIVKLKMCATGNIFG